MKKFLLFLVVIAASFAMVPAFAQEASVPSPDLIALIFAYVSAIPVAGPYLAIAGKAVMIIAGVMTALSLFVEGLMQSLAFLANVASLAPYLSGLKKFADALKKFNAFVQPYLKYASIFNAPKKP